MENGWKERRYKVAWITVKRIVLQSATKIWGVRWEIWKRMLGRMMKWKAVDGGNASKMMIAEKSKEIYCTFSIEKKKGCN